MTLLGHKEQSASFKYMQITLATFCWGDLTLHTSSEMNVMPSGSTHLCSTYPPSTLQAYAWPYNLDGNWCFTVRAPFVGRFMGFIFYIIFCGNCPFSTLCCIRGPFSIFIASFPKSCSRSAFSSSVFASCSWQHAFSVTSALGSSSA